MVGFRHSSAAPKVGDLMISRTDDFIAVSVMGVGKANSAPNHPMEMNRFTCVWKMTKSPNGFIEDGDIFVGGSTFSALTLSSNNYECGKSRYYDLPYGFKSLHILREIFALPDQGGEMGNL